MPVEATRSVAVYVVLYRDPYLSDSKSEFIGVFGSESDAQDKINRIRATREGDMYTNGKEWYQICQHQVRLEK